MVTSNFSNCIVAVTRMWPVHVLLLFTHTHISADGNGIPLFHRSYVLARPFFFNASPKRKMAESRNPRVNCQSPLPNRDLPARRAYQRRPTIQWRNIRFLKHNTRPFQKRNILRRKKFMTHHAGPGDTPTRLMKEKSGFRSDAGSLWVATSSRKMINAPLRIQPPPITS